jgi:uncharacterized low-complexity protein
MFAKLDADGDGNITREEMDAFIAKMAPAAEDEDKCGEGKAEEQESKCGEGKCGEGKCGK